MKVQPSPIKIRLMEGPENYNCRRGSVGLRKQSLKKYRKQLLLSTVDMPKIDDERWIMDQADVEEHVRNPLVSHVNAPEP